MFDKMKEALDILYKDQGVWKLDKDIDEMDIPHINKYSHYFDKDEKRERRFVKPEDVERLISSVDEGLDGIHKLEDLMEEIKWMRGRLVSQVLDLRNAYKPPVHSELFETLVKLAESKDCKEGAIRTALAGILEWEDLPDQIVKLSVGWCSGCDAVYIRFGINGKPTTATIVLPVVVDYASEYKIPKDIEGQMDFPVSSLEDRRPEILYVVTPGVYTETSDYDTFNRDNFETRCKDLEDLKGKIINTIGYDVRDGLKKVNDIEDVISIDDFRNWRFLRAANRAAALNSKKEQPDG